MFKLESDSESINDVFESFRGDFVRPSRDADVCCVRDLDDAVEYAYAPSLRSCDAVDRREYCDDPVGGPRCDAVVGRDCRGDAVCSP